MPELSIIIPAYNEEARLPSALEAIRNWVAARRIDAEIIVVADGPTDNTLQVAMANLPVTPGLRIISNHINRGKGFSVRAGMLAAYGRVALFTDADLSAPIEEAEKLLAALESADVAIGSRGVDRSLIRVHQSRSREFAGICFNLIVRAVTGLPFLDTQCGFKAFLRKRARIVFEQQRSRRFGFDPEILFLARRHGLRTVEIPVRWAHDPRTKVNVLRDSFGMFLDLLLIRWNALLGRYPKSPPR